jgi:hypothetical protein
MSHQQSISTARLIKGQRYLFHKQSPNHEQTMFRANYIDVIGNTLRVSKRQVISSPSYYDNSVMVTMPLEWISKIESLDETLADILIPDDILLQIDNYI